MIHECTHKSLRNCVILGDRVFSIICSHSLIGKWLRHEPRLSENQIQIYECCARDWGLMNGPFLEPGPGSFFSFSYILSLGYKNNRRPSQVRQKALNFALVITDPCLFFSESEGSPFGVIATCNGLLGQILGSLLGSLVVM